MFFIGHGAGGLSPFPAGGALSQFYALLHVLSVLVKHFGFM